MTHGIQKYTLQIFVVFLSIFYSLVAQSVKSLPSMWETWVQSLGQEDPLEKDMETHSSILAWKSHGPKSLVGYSPWGHKSKTQRRD